MGGRLLEKMILYINPVRDDDPEEIAILSRNIGAGIQLEYKSLGEGPEHLQYRFYRSAILTRLLAMIKQAENDGFEAVIVGCFLDPGVEEGREIAERTLIVGPGEASTHIAATLGDRFSILVTEKNAISEMAANLIRYGLKDKLASFRSIDTGVLELQRDRATTAKRLREAGEEAIKNDRAEVIILGCTGAHGFYKQLQKDLGVPVIDPGIAAVRFAEFLVELKNKFGWKHSKVGVYRSPPKEEILNWQLGEAELWQ